MTSGIPFGQWEHYGKFQESFYHVEWLPYLKLRASYGFNGNIDPAMVAVSTIAFDTDKSRYTGTSVARFDNYFLIQDCVGKLPE